MYKYIRVTRTVKGNGTEKMRRSGSIAVMERLDTWIRMMETAVLSPSFLLPLFLLMIAIILPSVHYERSGIT